jgi:hypothetical protein
VNTVTFEGLWHIDIRWSFSTGIWQPSCLFGSDVREVTGRLEFERRGESQACLEESNTQWSLDMSARKRRT